MFDKPSWCALAGAHGKWEAEWRGLDWPDDGECVSFATSRLFRDAGVAVMRAGRDHDVVATNGIVEPKALGNHKHNDQLSFEYNHSGVPLVVDDRVFVVVEKSTVA